MKYLPLILLFLVGCAQHTAYVPTLASVNIVDQSGMTQTIGSKERLKGFCNVDFQKPQPYQKVLRVFNTRPDGAIPAVVTCYYPSGQIKQSLSILSGRALGPYREWYENGALKIEGYLVGGSPQLGPAFERTWIFDGPCKAYNDQGQLIGSMTYVRGSLSGEALFLADDGTCLKKIKYEKGLVEGVAEYFYPSGKINQRISYHLGVRHGPLSCWREDESLLAEELYVNGHLITATYKGAPPEAIVKEGFGYRYTEIGEGYHLEEIRSGELCGEVKEFRNGRLTHSYSQKKGVKEGKEYFWDEACSYLEIPYKAGIIQGEVITRYRTGELQSRREMSNNLKNGSLRAWYTDGQMMMAEEYNNDNLQSGSYYKKGSGLPVSRVMEGSGTATIFDNEGHIERKILYKDGKPQ
jgi:antitoxin component YwqK of YwqJK toxin-antitoxin module